MLPSFYLGPIWLTTLLLTLIVLGRYFVIAGLAYWLCYIKNPITWAEYRIQRKRPAPGMIWREIFWSISTSIIFGISGTFLLHAWRAGYTAIYLSISDYGWPYLIVSLGLLLFLHETFFYWTHRWIHYPKLFRYVHYIHHDSIVPTPWAAFSFHPWEALLEAMMLPILVFLVPVHPSILIICLTFMTLTSVINHIGFELYPAFMIHRKPFSWLINATHHDMHHQLFRCNYGLYFRFWDRLMGTEHKKYNQAISRSANCIQKRGD